LNCNRINISKNKKKSKEVIFIDLLKSFCKYIFTTWHIAELLGKLKNIRGRYYDKTNFITR